MKNVIFTFVALTLFSNLFAGDGNFHLDKEYKIGKNGMLEMQISDAKVFITGSTRTTAHVKIDRTVTSKGFSWGTESFHVDVNEANGNLSIKEKQNSTHVTAIGYYSEEYRIDVELPEGVSLKVDGDDGDYYIKNVNGAISLHMDDADAELAGCKGDSFEFRVDDGDIRMDQGRGKLEVDGDDADVEIYKANFTSIHADIDDGDLIIETSLANDGTYWMKSQDGQISLNITAGGGEFDIDHDDGRVITEGKFKVLKQDEGSTVVALANGTAKVTVKADDARVKLRAQ